MSYPIIPHPRIITGSATTTRVSYSAGSRSAYTHLSRGVKTFFTRTIPKFAARVGAGLYRVAKFVYSVVKQGAKFLWRLMGNAARGTVKALKQVPHHVNQMGKGLSKTVRGVAETGGKVVGGAVRRVGDFNRGFAEGVAGDTMNYVKPKFKTPDAVDKFGQAKVDRAVRRGAARRKAVAGGVRRAMLGAEIAGGLKLVSKSIEGLSDFSISTANGFNFLKGRSENRTPSKGR